MYQRADIALSGLMEINALVSQGYASLHPGLRVLRASGTKGRVLISCTGR